MKPKRQRAPAKRLRFIHFDRLDQLDGILKGLSPTQPPSAFTVIDVASIRSTMQAIEDEIERDAPAGEMAGKHK